jgi:hypothetical protein
VSEHANTLIFYDKNPAITIGTLVEQTTLLVSSTLFSPDRNFSALFWRDVKNSERNTGHDA